MSMSARERLRVKLKTEKREFLERHTELKIEDIKWLTENYIEEICRESDLRCEKIDPLKAVDQVIDEMDDEAFDKFIKGCMEDVKARIDKNKKLNRKRRQFEQESIETQVPLVYPDNKTPFERPQQMEATH